METFDDPTDPTLDLDLEQTDMLSENLDMDTPILPPATPNPSIFTDDLAPQDFIQPIASSTLIDDSDIEIDGTVLHAVYTAERSYVSF